MSAPRLSMRGIAKAYGGVDALRGVDLDLGRCEIHALVGENGAGKSTLVKILGGAVRADRGAMAIDGREVAVRSPADARALGIAVVHQDLRLVPELTVADNVFLGREVVHPGSWPPLCDVPAMERGTRAILSRLGESSLKPGRRVAELGVAQCQLVEIARGLAHDARVLALDEPTAALSAPEVERLFAALVALRAAGAGILYISHRLEEVLRIADRITVLRDGEVVHTGAARELDRAGLVRRMVGRELGDEYPRRERPRGEAVLRTEGLMAPGLAGIDLSLHRGEVLGLAGLVGAGRSTLAHVLFGALPRTGGRVVLDGRHVEPRSPREAIDLGIALLTEDRNRLGLVAELNVRENATLPTLARFLRGPFVARSRESRAVRAITERLRLKPPDVEAPIGALSGGNRQKVVLARWLLAGARVMIFDEPTAGVDVGAKHEIYEVIQELAAAGTAVLVISSDLRELLGVSDRIVVMRDGEITGELDRAEATEERVMTLALAPRPAA